MNARNAEAFARAAAHEIEVAVSRGAVTLRDIAADLNARGVPTRLGGRWHPATVKRVLFYASRSNSPTRLGPVRRKLLL